MAEPFCRCQYSQEGSGISPVSARLKNIWRELLLYATIPPCRSLSQCQTMGLCTRLLPDMQGCTLLLLLALCRVNLHFAMCAGITSAFDGQCKKVVAFFALQTTTVDGQRASYLGESSLKYQQHLKVALISIRQNCPSIRPVVVSMYSLDEATVAWVKALGAEVMIHQLTFSKDVLKTAELPEYAWVKGVISTYLRTEVWPFQILRELSCTSRACASVLRICRSIKSLQST